MEVKIKQIQEVLVIESFISLSSLSSFRCRAMNLNGLKDSLTRFIWSALMAMDYPSSSSCSVLIPSPISPMISISFGLILRPEGGLFPSATI
jgi:hypothetical protein